MKLEVGMYVRTDRGKIGKFKKETGYYFELEYPKNVCDLIFKNRLKKASFNILELIEVGDYVNGEIVTNVENGYLAFGDFDYYITDKNDIKSVLTKEQFESMKYEV